ncbi:MAG TPA: penicillin-binding transpeptidase domain-containing protein [Gaiellaceae bacterium]|nr:penicillin-binding transpeptidase domain-containing protein [Gaiellaceae bacterium]
MNKQISRVAMVALLLLASLIVATTYWQSWEAPSLAAKQDNAIQRVAQFRIKRGLIYASDGKTVLAANVVRKTPGGTLYFRRYPTNGLASQIVGYSTQGRSRAGIERQENAYLTASNANLGTIFDKLSQSLKGTTVTGNNLVLNIHVGAQKIAETALQGKCGAAVVLNPKTGQVYVMASSPGYNPNKIESAHGYASILRSPSACPGSSSALYNRATEGLYAPGSTFKTVTAAAALDSGKFTPSSSFYDPGYCTEYGVQVHNALDQNGPEQFGNVDLIQAYIHSINAVFCNLGIKLGAKTVLDQAKKFGFYSTPPIELPPNEVAPSGLYDFRKHRLFDKPSAVDPGRLAFGQERMLVTPLQMALVAAGVANNGTIMVPHLVRKVKSAGGSTVVTVHPQVWKHAMTPATAAALNQMMQGVVQSGTGTAAQIPGVKVAGKTGTAETGAANIYTAWFIFFAPADNPQVAGAIAVEHQLNGFGGAIAAPIAKQLMQAILTPASKH